MSFKAIVLPGTGCVSSGPSGSRVGEPDHRRRGEREKRGRESQRTAPVSLRVPRP